MPAETLAACVFECLLRKVAFHRHTENILDASLATSVLHSKPVTICSYWSAWQVEMCVSIAGRPLPIRVIPSAILPLKAWGHIIWHTLPLAHRENSNLCQTQSTYCSPNYKVSYSVWCFYFAHMMLRNGSDEEKTSTELKTWQKFVLKLSSLRQPSHSTTEAFH